MSANDSPAQTSPLSQFDLAIMRALRKNPQGLRYSELLRKSSEEYGRMNREKGINVKTFDKHLKNLVSEGALERIEEKRSRVFYRLMIPEDSFPKRFVEAHRDAVAKLLDNLRDADRDELPKAEAALVLPTMEPMVDALVTSIGLTMLSAIEAYEINATWGRYVVDESMELHRREANATAGMFGKFDSHDLLPVINGLRVKWEKQLERIGDRLLQSCRTCAQCGRYYSKTLDKCPDCGT